MEGWLAALRGRLVGAITSARSRSLASKRSNLSRLTRHCLRFFERQGHAAGPNDKETGFTLVSGDALTRIHKNILSSGDYIRVPRSEASVEEWGRSYEALCHRVATQLQHPSLHRSLMRSVTVPGCKSTARLMVNCKTHKDTVAWRNIHAGGSSCFSSLGIWTCRILQQQADKLPHILKGCEDFCSWASHVVIGPSDYMIRIDIEHFS